MESLYIHCAFAKIYYGRDAINDAMAREQAENYSVKFAAKSFADMAIASVIGFAVGYIGDEKLPDSVVGELSGTVGAAYGASFFHASTHAFDWLTRFLDAIPLYNFYRFDSAPLTTTGLWAGLYMGRMTRKLG